jgi:hypothetical protein
MTLVYDVGVQWGNYPLSLTSFNGKPKATACRIRDAFGLPLNEGAACFDNHMLLSFVANSN